MDWTYISPHLDDVAFSCGGLIWEQTKAGEQVDIWTIFAGDPPQGPLSDFAERLQTRWREGRESMSRRREEDILACARIGAAYRHFALPDCIYRGSPQSPNESKEEQGMDIPGDRDFFYTSHQSLFGPIHPAEIKMADQLGQVLARLLPEETELVCPLTLGDHVDHKLTRAALEKLGRPLWYYADFPYAINCLERIEALERSGWRSQIFQVSEEGMEAWKQAAAGHQSQISSFWPDSKAMEKELEYYREFFGGVMLFNPRISSKKE